jgi:hypothetical protein
MATTISSAPLVPVTPVFSSTERFAARRADDVGGDDVGCMPVQGGAGAVVAHGSARVGVRGGFLDVAQWHAGVQCRGDEGVPQRVRPD